jgi:hypothetical protein
LALQDEQRVGNLDQMFNLSEFWSSHVQDELLLIGSQVSDLLQSEDAEVDEHSVKQKLTLLANLRQREIGKRGLAICHTAIYQFAAATPSVVSDILRQCQDQASYATR